MKGSDSFLAEIVVLDASNNEVASAKFEGSLMASWTNQTVKLEYKSFNQASSMYIRFVSGKETSTDQDDYPIQPGIGNLTGGEYVGSQLYIDNVELIYE